MGLTTFALKTNVLASLSKLVTDGSADIVALGLPAELPSNQQPVRVYVLNVPQETPSPVYGPSTQMRKVEYPLPLALEVVSYTGNDPDGQASVLARMQQLVEAVEAVQQADPEWGGAVLQSGLVLASERTGPIAAQAGGWMSQAVLELRVMSRGV